MMPKYELGQRVKHAAVMYRSNHGVQKKWQRLPLSGEGTIVGKRTVSDGYSEYQDYTNIYTATRYHSFYLVAYNLTGYRHVAEEDIIAVEVPRDTDALRSGRGEG